MKIFCTEYPLLSGVGNDASGSEPFAIRHAFMRGDSSINNSGKVLVRPFWSNELCGLPLLVVKVGRVGRHFEAHHTEKYVSEGALGFGLADRGYFREALKRGFDPGLAYNFDGSLFLSRFMPLDTFPKAFPEVILRGDDRLQKTLEVQADSEQIGRTVAEISRYYLMKMGDLVTFPLCGSMEVFEEDERRLFEGPAGELLLDLSVKVYK